MPCLRSCSDPCRPAGTVAASQAAWAGPRGLLVLRRPGTGRDAGRRGFASRLYRVPRQAGARLCRASAIRLRAQRREVLPNISASLRSEIGLPSWTLAR